MSAAGERAEGAGLLVVEDDPVLVQCLRRMLPEGWNVFVAGTVAEGEAMLARHPEIGVLLCDHQLPDGEGLAFCDRLARRGSAVVRVLMTGYTETTLLKDAVNRQCLFQFISKPFGTEEMLEALTRAQAAYGSEVAARAARVEAERRREKGSIKEKIGRGAQIVFGLGSFALATVVVVAVTALVLGAVVFVVLYVLKSALGIDVFSDGHLGDFLRF